MEKILQWSIANQSDDPEARARAPEITSEDLNKFFGGQKDDAVLMAENMATIISKEASLDNKLISFENFEMLLENLDNSNNLKNMNLWEPLLNNLQGGGHPEDEDNELIFWAAGCVGVAVQNNRQSQDDFLQFVKRHVHDSDDGVNYFDILLNLAFTSKQANVQKKSIFALSNLIRYNYPNYVEFVRCDGWKKLAEFLSHFDSLNNNLRLRTLSLLSSLLTIDPDYSDGFAKEPPKAPLLVKDAPGKAPGEAPPVGTVQAHPVKHDREAEIIEKLKYFKELSIVQLVLKASLTNGEINQSLIDQILILLNNLITLGYGTEFTNDELTQLKTLIDKLDQDQDIDKEFVIPLKSVLSFQLPT